MRTLGALLAILGALSLVWTGLQVSADQAVLASGPSLVTTSAHGGYRVPALESIIVLLGGITILRLGLRRMQVR